ncbi:MAG: methyltransferase domain-containing protein, partial [Candidatus Binataceae bacterium]
IPLNDGAVDKLVSNLPWGIRHGSHEDNRRLYPRLFEEFRRVVRKGGLMVLLTGESALMRSMIARAALTPEEILRVSMLGAPAAIYVIPV